MSFVQFSFESSSIRTLGDAISPLFVAADVAAILGYGSTKDATRILDDDEKQTVSIDTNGGKQSMTVVTESGLYAMILKSRRPEAKRFRKWVTSEVLPAIRKTGQYQCPVAPKLTAQYLTVPHQYAIQSAVAKRVHKDDVSYQTVYQALKARFQVPKYTYILDKDFEAAVEFIRTCELRVPEKPQEEKAEAAPEQIEHKTYVVREDFLIRLRTFVYCWRYLFRDDLMLVYNFLKTSKSPLAPQFAEAVMDFNIVGVEESLAKLGFAVKDLDCYKHWSAKRLTA